MAYRVMQVDVAIIGAGIAGASLAAYLPESVRTIILEAEAQPGYHTTGRSAAFYSETYGGPEVQPLTTASKDWFFSTLAPGESNALMVTRQGALHVGWEVPESALSSFAAPLRTLCPNIDIIDADACLEKCAALNREGLVGGVWDPDSCDIDVAAVHRTFLGLAKTNGHSRVCDFQVSALERRNGLWHITSSRGDTVSAALLGKAAGAWSDEIGHLAGAPPLGLAPLRRTIGLFDVKGMAISPDLPLTLDLDERFYFKEQSGHLLVSPADEIPSPPCDAQPAMEEIALAAHRVEGRTHYQLTKCPARWAGLRTFAPDRAPVYGFDPIVEGFFWCAGQGGFGIQTAPAAGQLAAALVLQTELPPSFETLGITSSRYAPRRFAAAA
ncbi:MAG: NAD(P)/FAD-dependent oxidoreductase [Sphingomonadales bacterium]